MVNNQVVITFSRKHEVYRGSDRYSGLPSQLLLQADIAISETDNFGSVIQFKAHVPLGFQRSYTDSLESTLRGRLKEFDVFVRYNGKR